MKLTEDNHLEHYGILRKSGRYPWGSGGGPPGSARNRSFLDAVANLKSQGMSDSDIAQGMGISINELRQSRTIALTQQKQEQIGQAQRLKDKGLSNGAIAARMNLAGESSVRALLAPGARDKADLLQATSDMLKRQIEEKGYIDVGRGVELSLPLSDGANIGISTDKFKTAIALLRDEGYKQYYLKVQQAGTGEFTNMKVLGKPNSPFPKVDQIHPITEFSEDRGRTWDGGLKPPKSISSSRVAVRYAEDGGSKEDGVIYLRPGVKDLSMGKSNYAQVRIAVDGTHYLKGMAVYKDNLPEGTDIVFNTNKKRGTPLKSKDPEASQVYKPMERRPDGSINKENPFTASIKPGGQKGYLNIVNEEGDWDNWSKNLSAQVLSKQSPALAKQQLDMTYERRKSEFNEISSLTNPAVRKKLLGGFADSTDSAAVHLGAAALKGQATRVILPINSIKQHEIYAPTFKDGTRVALVRFPHAGTFEIPQLTVNNKNPEAKKILGSAAADAVGIHHKVAEHLSGADFDGDHVLVLPNNKGSIKSTPALEGLKGFDPQTYKIPEGSSISKIKPSRKEQEMGKITNLIQDMTVRGAGTEDLARAVRHSMVVIDSEKHGLDFKRSEADHGILQLKERYQGSKKSGASTLITRSPSKDHTVPARKPRPESQGGPIDKVTGKKVFVRDTSKDFVNRKGETVIRKQQVRRGFLTDDAHTLTSTPATRIEVVYANHSNKLRALANDARKELVTTKSIPYSPSAKKVYAHEVASLDAKLNIAKKNAPRERQAQRLANTTLTQKKQANPNMDKDTEKKIKNQALVEARIRTKAAKDRIEPTQSEWDAIQAGAISNHKLNEILDNSNIEVIKKLATPKTPKLMTSTKLARAQAMLANGFTQAEVAQQLGVSLSTLKLGISE